jgi:hypothetical protein
MHYFTTRRPEHLAGVPLTRIIDSTAILHRLTAEQYSAFGKRESASNPIRSLFVFVLLDVCCLLNTERALSFVQENFDEIEQHKISNWRSKFHVN